MDADMRIELLHKCLSTKSNDFGLITWVIHNSRGLISDLRARIVELENSTWLEHSKLRNVWESRWYSQWIRSGESDCEALQRVMKALQRRHAALESTLASQLLDGTLESAHVLELVLYAVVVSAVSLLSLVYQYLNGHVDKGGTLTCSTGSFQFRATYISIVLFEGAYVWIKFRDIAPSKLGGYRRPMKDKLSGTIKLSKPEARYTPPGQSGDHIYLGVCATDEEAGIKKQIAAFYYGRGQGTLDLGHGHHFQIPPVHMEQLQERSPSVKEKRKWVRDKVREVYESFDKQKAILRASHDEVDGGDYCTFLEKVLELESSSDMMFDSQPQQDDQVQASAMVVPMFDERGDAEPLETGYSWSSQDFLDVAATSIGNQDEGALTTQHCAPQISSILRASHDEVDGGDFCMSLEKFLELDPSSDTIFDSQPQQDDQVQASAMAVPMFDERGDAEPLGTAYSWSSQDSLGVAATSIGNQDEGALTTQHCAPQISSICEFPMMSSMFTAQPGMDHLKAALSDVVTPPLTNFRLTDSTPNVLSDVLAMKLISLLEQKNQDQDQKIQDQEQKIQDQEWKIQERDRKIVELELENEQLRASTSLS